MVKIHQQNGTISEKGQKSSTKMVLFQKRVKIPQQNGTISEKGQKSSTKIKPHYKNGTISSFQKRVKLPRNKNCTISEKGQNSSIKMVKKVKIP